MQPPGIALDVGRGPLRLSGASHLFLTHGHLDHTVGLPYLLSHRSMQDAGEPTTVYCPREIVDRLRAFVEAASRLEERPYRFELRGLRPGDRVEVRRDFVVEAFRTEHPVASLGFHLLRRKSRLAEELRGLESEEIARRRQAGEEVDRWHEELSLSYCGDTGPGVFESEPRLFEAPLLMIEMTYLSSDFESRARDYGHLHLDDLVPIRERFDNETILLYHLSRRHRPRELRRAVDERLPELARRIEIWGELRGDD